MLQWRHLPEPVLFLPVIVYYTLLILLIHLFDTVLTLRTTLKKATSPRSKDEARLGWALITAANPAIPTGGLVGESKFAILDVLQFYNPSFIAQSVFISANGFLAEPQRGYSKQELTDSDGKENVLKINKDQILKRFHATIHTVTKQLDYPVVLKPDVGQRGNQVSIMRHPLQAVQYLQEHHQSRNLIAQEYISGPREVGIFYYRYPWHATGRILSIVLKTFPAIYGDGRRFLRDLIEEFVKERLDPRSKATADTYMSHFSTEQLLTVPSAGQRVQLTELGNGEQGAILTDVTSQLLTPELEARIDFISNTFKGFHIGRYDIRYVSDEDLRRGANFAVVELNGVGAEDLRIRCLEMPLWQFWYLNCVVVTKALCIAWWNVRVGRTAVVMSIRELWRMYAESYC